MGAIASSSSAGGGPVGSAATTKIEAKRDFVEELIAMDSDGDRKTHCKKNKKPYGGLYLGYARKQLIAKEESLTQEIHDLRTASGKYNLPVSIHPSTYLPISTYFNNSHWFVFLYCCFHVR